MNSRRDKRVPARACLRLGRRARLGRQTVHLVAVLIGSSLLLHFLGWILSRLPIEAFLLRDSNFCHALWLERNLTAALADDAVFPGVQGVMFLAATEGASAASDLHRDPPVYAAVRVRHRDIMPFVPNSSLGLLHLHPRTLQYLPGSARYADTGGWRPADAYGLGAEDPRVLSCGVHVYVFFNQPELEADLSRARRRLQHALHWKSGQVYMLLPDAPTDLDERHMPLSEKNYAPVCVNGSDLYALTSVMPLRLLGPCRLRRDRPPVFADGRFRIHGMECPVQRSEFPPGEPVFRDAQLLRGGTQFVEVVRDKAYVALAHSKRYCGYDCHCHQPVVLVLLRPSEDDWRLVFYPSALRLYSSTELPMAATATRPGQSAASRAGRACLARRLGIPSHSLHLWHSMVQDPVSIVRIEADGDARITLSIDDQQVVVARLPGLRDYVQRVQACFEGDRRAVLYTTRDRVTVCRNGARYTDNELAIRDLLQMSRDVAERYHPRSTPRTIAVGTPLPD
ncbi:hypothetical protein CDCA_CDCA16G4171 [Cyanidium caldarium]|uniref:Uncharacterized protein n=1 Tax=Cyanidium caldarium TaxID=2771 RepID=A0AAV9J193_CYACA|nr:hypothetical protein CDCA_CDCA16G4171 [Cyanidium caldarium]